MTYERIAGCRPDISGIFTVDYLVTKDKVLLKVNKTKLIGMYPTIAAARDVVNGLLTLNGCNEPYDTSFRFTETITNTDTTTVQNSQTGNSVGTMFSQTSTGGIVDVTTPEYIELRTDVAGTSNSRARVINENEAFANLAADLWRSYNYKRSIYKARASIPVFDYSLWNSNVVTLGFHGNHAALGSPTTYNCEKGCIFTPNSLGNWRCRWCLTADVLNKPFNEVLFKDTQFSASVPTDLQIIIEDFGRTATWLINNKVVFSCDYRDSPQTAYTLLSGVPTIIQNVIYSDSTDDASTGEPPSLGFAAYVGAEVRRRTTSSAQHSLRLFSQSLETQG